MFAFFGGVVTRRRFLSVAAGVGAGLLLPGALRATWERIPRGRPLKLGYLASPDPHPSKVDAAFGVALGVEEARRAADLLSVQVHLTSATAREDDLQRAVRELSVAGV